MRLRGLVVGASLLAATAACDDGPPMGPGGTGGDTIAPSVQITALRPGPLVIKGDLVLVDVRVDDNGEVAAIDAAVSGALGFLFPTIVPETVPFTGQFPVPTTDAELGSVTFTVTAFDVDNNMSADSISFTILAPNPP